MRKLKIVAFSLLLAAMTPGFALAHNDGDRGDGDHEDDIRDGFRILRVLHRDHEEHKNSSHRGMVTAVAASSFTMKQSDSTMLTVNIDADTKIKLSLGDKVLQLTDLKVDDKVVVKGDLSASAIDADKVSVTPAHTHKAKIPKGTVSAVNGSTLTVQTNNHGVISNVTVTTDSNTTVKKADGTVGTTADVQIGASVKIKGFWDEILSVLRAIKIRIK